MGGFVGGAGVDRDKGENKPTSTAEVLPGRVTVAGSW